MGSVFRAVQRDRGQVVALKVMKPTLASDDQYTRRFLHEARAASELEHEHLVPLLDFGFAHGRPYLAMRYVVGRSLGERIDAEGPLPIGDAVRIAGQVGRALDALHARGLVHRDVKPANIMLDQAGTASLTDFGLAKGDGYSTVTKPGQIVGTLDYLAPELIKGEPAGPMSDLYALGCVVFECLCGRPPFAGKRVFEAAPPCCRTSPLIRVPSDATPRRSSHRASGWRWPRTQAQGQRRASRTAICWPRSYDHQQPKSLAKPLDPGQSRRGRVARHWRGASTSPLDRLPGCSSSRFPVRLGPRTR